tara:strand:- start:1502 stop:3316 length:1815 start_codon:yes stop_codon:yes gene_type:complete
MSTTTGSGIDNLVVKKSTVGSATEYELVKSISGTASSGNSTTLVDTGVLTQADDFWIGSTIEIVSGTGAGTIKTITDSDQSSTNVIVSGGFGFTVDSTTKYRINSWKIINMFVDQAADNIVAEFMLILDNFDHDGDDIGDAETMTFPDGTILQLGDFITIYFEDDTTGTETALFKGKVEEYTARQHPKHGREELLIAGRNFASELMDSVVIGEEYEDISRGNIVRDFISPVKYAYNLTAADTSSGGFVNNSDGLGATLLTKKLSGMMAWDIIADMAEEINFTYFVDAALRMHFHERDYTDTGVSFTEGTDRVTKFQFPDTTKDVINKVLLYGGSPTAGITGITKASSAVVTAAGHGFEVGDLITFSEVLGMYEINTLEGPITAADTNTFTVDIDSSGFVAVGGTGLATRNQVVGTAESIASQEFYGSASKPYVREKVMYDDSLLTDLEANEKAINIVKKYEFPVTRGAITVAHTIDAPTDYPTLDVGKIYTINFPRQKIDGQFMLLRKRMSQHPYRVSMEFAQFAQGVEFQIQDILKELRKQRAEEQSLSITTKVLSKAAKLKLTTTIKIEEREEDAFIYNSTTWNSVLGDSSGPWSQIYTGTG